MRSRWLSKWRMNAKRGLPCMRCAFSDFEPAVTRTKSVNQIIWNNFQHFDKRVAILRWSIVLMEIEQPCLLRLDLHWPVESRSWTTISATASFCGVTAHQGWYGNKIEVRNKGNDKQISLQINRLVWKFNQAETGGGCKWINPYYSDEAYRKLGVQHKFSQTEKAKGRESDDGVKTDIKQSDVLIISP